MAPKWSRRKFRATLNKPRAAPVSPPGADSSRAIVRVHTDRGVVAAHPGGWAQTHFHESRTHNTKHRGRRGGLRQCRGHAL